MSEKKTRILVVDNYDSFVFNLVQYLGQIGAECTVLRNDEVKIEDASNFTGALTVRGYEVDGYKVLRATGVAVPNSLAALLLHLGQLSGKRAHAYFNWGERGPASYLMKFLFSGEGDIAPLTREILRRCETDPSLRPVIHAAS